MSLTVAAMLLAGMTHSPESSPFTGLVPVSDATMAETRGGAITHRWLVTETTEESAIQLQLVDETMRSTIDNWFADTNVQIIANAAISG